MLLKKVLISLLFHDFSEKPQPYEVSREDSVDDEIPGVDLSHLSPSEREQIRAVMRMAQMDDPGAQRRREGMS